MNRFSLMGIALLFCTAGTFAQYTNVLENAATQTVSTAWVNDSVWVGQTTSSNALHVVSGGAIVSTNVYVGASAGASNNVVSVTGGRWDIEETLAIGPGTGNSVSVAGGGTIYVGDLSMGASNSLNLNSGGTFAIRTNFNAAIDGFNWNEGGHLSVGDDLTGMALSNNAVYLDDGRDLTIDGGSWTNATHDLIVGLNGSGSDLIVHETGTLSSASAYIGWGTNAANNTVTIRGGSVWNNSGDLRVGFGGTGNALILLDGGTNTVGGDAYIGSANTTGNRVHVEGSNSLWNVAGSLTVNAGNRLELDSGGAISLGGDMNIHSNATIGGTGTIGFGPGDSVLAFSGAGIGLSSNIVFDGGLGSNRVSVADGTFYVVGSNAQQYVNFQTLGTDHSRIAGFGTLDAFDRIELQGGVIDPVGIGTDAARLEITGGFSSSGTVYRAQVYNTSWDELVFTGPGTVDLAGLEADVYVPMAPAGLTATILSSAGGITNDFSSSTVVDRLLLYDARLEVVGNNVNVVVEPNNTKFSSSLDFAGTEAVRAGFSGMKNLVFTRTQQLRRNLVATAHAIPREIQMLTATNAPAGAMGPGDDNIIFDMHVWMQQYGGQGDYEAPGGSDSFTLNNTGTAIGFDRLVSEAMTVGVNYTYARSAARTTNSDSLDTETYWLGAYGEWVGEEGLYVNALAAYGRSNYDSVRLEENYRGSASYRGSAVGAAVDVGQYYHYKTLALSPYAGLHVLSLVADGHNETDDAGSVVRVDQTERTWVDSALGLKLRHRFDTRAGRFQTTGFAEWTHDFIQDDIYSTLSADGLPPVSMARISPDADVLSTGLGYSWICTDYMEVGIGYNGRFSDNYEEHTGSIMFDIMF